MADPLSGFRLAQQGVQLSNKTADSPYKFSSNTTTDPLLGFRLAQQGVDLSPPTFKKSYRYPLAALDGSNGGTDYLEIKIIEYSAPGFNIPSGSLRLPSAGSSSSLKNPLYYILLPIPQNLSDSNSVDWGDSTIDPLSGLGISGIQDMIGSDNPLKQAASEISNIVNTALGTIKTGEGQKLVSSTVAGALVSSLGSNVSVGSILSRATGQIVNPNLELLFNGVTLRNFQFSFDFAPRSPEEGQEVRQIIRLFKKHMSAKSNATSGNGLLIKSPEVFQLTFKSGSSDHPFLFKLKPTALLSMDVNYNASGPYATYRDGTPVHMTMNMMFKELSPIYAEDYDTVTAGVGY